VEDPRRILAYQRTYANDRIVVILNFSSRELSFMLPEGNWLSMVADVDTLVSDSITLSPYQVNILKRKG
jgi:hypothetical protein